jgi:hypothetical protein
VKAAWRILTDKDTPAIRRRYYVVKDAEVLDVAKSLRAGAAVCAKHDIALVGLHIVIKTTYRPQWIWSSFEHIDNVPPVGADAAREPDAKDANVPYSYNDPQRVQHLTSFDSPEMLAVSASHPPKLDPDPTQVVRTHPINSEMMTRRNGQRSLSRTSRLIAASHSPVASSIRISQWTFISSLPIILAHRRI